MTAGYQKIYLTAGPFTTVAFPDAANISVTFLVGGAPGTYTLGFKGGGGNGAAFDCQAAPTTLAVTSQSTPFIPALDARGVIVLLAALAISGFHLLRR